MTPIIEIPFAEVRALAKDWHSRNMSKRELSGTVRLNLLETGRATLQPRLMIKHSTSRYIKPGPWFLDHLVLARGPGTKRQGTIVYRAGTFVLPSALPGLN